MSQKEKAQTFRELHKKKELLILPNAWDVPSARIFENTGFPAVATSSAGMMVSLGYQDGETISKEEFLSALNRIARVLSIPLSADIVGGFGETPEEVGRFAGQVIQAGAVGVNIEDFSHATKKLHPVELQLQKIKAIRNQADLLDIPIVINARTDALRFAEGEDKMQEAISRAKAYRDEGRADCVYPMGLVDHDSISRFVRELDFFPVNVMVRKGLPSIPELQKLGVKRISFGPTASYAAMGLLKRISNDLLEKQDFQGLVEGAISIDELNSLAIPRS
jgi:2-methylisocitrate lyase-like PEP mutase family enzyme